MWRKCDKIQVEVLKNKGEVRKSARKIWLYPNFLCNFAAHY